MAAFFRFKPCCDDTEKLILHLDAARALGHTHYVCQLPWRQSYGLRSKTFERTPPKSAFNSSCLKWAESPILLAYTTHMLRDQPIIGQLLTRWVEFLRKCSGYSVDNLYALKNSYPGQFIAFVGDDEPSPALHYGVPYSTATSKTSTSTRYTQ